MGAIGEKTIRTGASGVTFMSRMPGFAAWAEHNINGQAHDQERMHELARTYARATEVDGVRRGRLDPLLRFYEDGGFTIGDVIPDAFTDPESLDYGVLCRGANPVPRPLRQFGIVNAAVGRLFAAASRRPQLLEKLVA